MGGVRATAEEHGGCEDECSHWNLRSVVAVGLIFVYGSGLVKDVSHGVRKIFEPNSKIGVIDSAFDFLAFWRMIGNGVH